MAANGVSAILPKLSMWLGWLDGKDSVQVWDGLIPLALDITVALIGD